MAIQIVGFDLDGTLIDTFSSVYRTDCQVIKEFGGVVPTPEEYKSELGTFDWLAMYTTFGVQDPKAAHAAYAKKDPRTAIMIPDVSRVLKILRFLKMPSFIASFNPRHDVVLDKVKDSGLAEFFQPDNIRTTEKNKTDIILEECNKRGIDPANAAFAGDSAFDVASAKEAGVISIGISDDRYSFHTRDMIASSEPNHLITHFRELEDII